MRSDRDRDHDRAVGREEEGWRVMARVGTDGATQKHTRWAAGYIKRAGARADGSGRRAAMHLHGTVCQFLYFYITASLRSRKGSEVPWRVPWRWRHRHGTYFRDRSEAVMETEHTPSPRNLFVRSKRSRCGNRTHPRQWGFCVAVLVPLFHVAIISSKTKRGFLTSPTRSQPRCGRLMMMMN